VIVDRPEQIPRKLLQEKLHVPRASFLGRVDLLTGQDSGKLGDDNAPTPITAPRPPQGRSREKGGTYL
jgi:hypothetical protein